MKLKTRTPMASPVTDKNKVVHEKIADAPDTLQASLDAIESMLSQTQDQWKHADLKAAKNIIKILEVKLNEARAATDAAVASVSSPGGHAPRMQDVLSVRSPL